MSARLVLDHVCKAFGGLQVTGDVSLALSAGDRAALIGPNGAGKTTLVNLITGDLRPSSGRILFDGVDVTRQSIAERSRHGLVRTFQVTRLFTSLTAAENVALAILQRRGRSRRFWSVAGKDAEVRDEALELLDALGIASLARQPVTELAYGQQRLLELAIGIALKPKVLLLDEPAAGVPHEDVPKILDAIDRLPPDVAVLMIEHDMDLVFRFARRVLVLAGGRLIFEGTPDAVKADAEVRRAYLGSYADARRSA